jgi:hypothetical protein
MRLPVVDIRKPLRQRYIQFPHVLMRPEVNALMFDRTPKPFNEHTLEHVPKIVEEPGGMIS